jgi:hypothetical protein
MNAPARRLRRTILGAGPAAALLTIGATVYLAVGSPGAAKVAGQTSVRPACATALIRDWTDGRIDGTYPLACYRIALRSLPTDIQVYSSAPDDISQALSQRIVQSAQQHQTRMGSQTPAG